MNEDHFSILIESDHQDILQSKKPWGDHYVLFAMFVVVVQSLSRVQLFVMPWTAACQASLFFTISWSLLKLMFIESVMQFIPLILYYPLLLPSIFLSIRVFSSELALLIRWPEYWSFNISISPSTEYWRLISFRIDWFGLLAVQGTIIQLITLTYPQVRSRQILDS